MSKENKRAIAEYRARRSERMKLRQDAKEEAKWITINGTHVPLDEEGNVTGPVGEKIKDSSPGSGKGKISVQKANSDIKSLILNERNYGQVDLEERRKKWADSLPAGTTITWGKGGKGGKATKLEDGTFECEDAKGKYREVPDPSHWNRLKPADSEHVMTVISSMVEDAMISGDWDEVGAKVTMSDGGKNKAAEVTYDRIPRVFSFGGSKYATAEEKKQRKEIISRFMDEAKEGNVYSVGGGIGSSGGSKFKVVRSRGKLALQWDNGGYSKPVEMSRANVEKYISNGAKLIQAKKE